MSFFQTCLIATALALVLERRLGFADWLVPRFGHPVVWIGNLISWLEARLNMADQPDGQRRLKGLVMLVLVLAVVGAITIGLMLALRLLTYGWVLEALIATSLLCQKELGQRVEQVADGLDTDVQQGRDAVAHLVGRDTKALDASEVSKAAIETLAENTSDGIIAPAFWMMIGGLPGAALYKAINTCDSMVGYRNARYGAFGWASAKLDDLVNLIPARLTGLLFTLATFSISPTRAARAWGAMRRDARKHASPNAGWPEAAMAGALDISLGGPRTYEGVVTELPYMGDGEKPITPGTIRQALGLYHLMLGFFAALIAAPALAWIFI
ncbi:MAG: cobalamin biosynthesis protein CobD [Alphaproteobacteria bacterium]|nr:cobalamin biosynthesis protein CobD [Alphaproteobacteria bacterium]